MSSVNKATILGRVGKIDTRTLDNGTQVTSFSVATSEKYKDKTTGESKEDTTWHNCTAWRKPAEIISKYVSKGDQIYIEGKLKTRSWEKDGITRYSTDIVVDEFCLLGGKKSVDDNGGGQQEPFYAGAGSSGDDSSLPF